MARPEVQQQMAAMQAMMQNEALQAKLQALRSDPEFAGMFEEIQKGGMGALMKYFNDERVLAKLGERLGDAVPAAAAAAAAGGAGAGGAAAAAAARGGAVSGAGMMGAGAPPDIDNIWDAAKYGDLEAVEDFLAIGKDASSADNEQRTPLHWAAGMGHAEVAALLLKEGAALEAADSKGNTPLAYAAGYGRPALVRMLLDAGADAGARNANGKTPADLTADPRNPLNGEPELIARLRAAEGAGAAA